MCDQKQKAAVRQDLKEEVRNAYFRFVDRFIRRLYNYARREIHLQILQGMLRPKELSVAEVLDEAIVEVAETLGQAFDSGAAGQKLYRAIGRIIEREVRTRGGSVLSLDRQIEPQDIDTELFEYYQPDVALRAEDMTPDPSAVAPEQRHEREEVEEIIRKALSFLPKDWRDSFFLMFED
jgi:hypothetical protein